MSEKEFRPWIPNKEGNHSYAHIIFPCQLEETVLFDNSGNFLGEPPDPVFLNERDKVRYCVSDFIDLEQETVTEGIKKIRERIKSKEVVTEEDLTTDVTVKDKKLRAAFPRGYFWYVGIVPYTSIYPL